MTGRRIKYHRNSLRMYFLIISAAMGARVNDKVANMRPDMPQTMKNAIYNQVNDTLSEINRCLITGWHYGGEKA